MNIAVTGPSGGNVHGELQAQTQLAVKSYARQLGISRLKTNILVKVYHKVFIEDATEGDCEPFDNRTFVIRVAMYGNWLSTLAHEMVHVKQFARGELDSGLSSWKSNKYCANIDYWDQPWEKEARRLQDKLAARFLKELDT